MPTHSMQEEQTLTLPEVTITYGAVCRCCNMLLLWAFVIPSFVISIYLLTK